MPIHFGDGEFAARRTAACAELAARDLDAILLFAPESQYWLTGYDTFGFAMFQCMVLTASGDVRLLTRLPDLRQALHNARFPEVAVSLDHCGFPPLENAQWNDAEPLFRLADHANLYLKVSTHVLDAAARVGEARAFVDALVSHFGAERLACPVVRIAPRRSGRLRRALARLAG